MGKINGWWLAFGLLNLADYTFSYNFGWIHVINVIFVFIGFGLAFRDKNKLKITKSKEL